MDGGIWSEKFVGCYFPTLYSHHLFFIVKQLYNFFIVILGKNFLNFFFPLSLKKNGLPREWDYVKEHDEYVLVHSLTFDIPGRQTVLSNKYILLMPA